MKALVNSSKKLIEVTVELEDGTTKLHRQKKGESLTELKARISGIYPDIKFENEKLKPQDVEAALAIAKSKAGTVINFVSFFQEEMTGEIRGAMFNKRDSKIYYNIKGSDGFNYHLRDNNESIVVDEVATQRLAEEREAEKAARLDKIELKKQQKAAEAEARKIERLQKREENRKQAEEDRKVKLQERLEERRAKAQARREKAAAKAAEKLAEKEAVAAAAEELS